MKQLFLLLSALLMTCTPLAARTTGDLLARTMVANEGRVVMGDSTLVSVYLYSDRPIHSYRLDDRRLKVKGGRLRCIYRGDSRRQSLTRLNGKPYYALVCAQYVFTPSKKGRTTLPAWAVKAELIEETVTTQRRIDPFFGPFDSWFTPTERKLVKGKTRTKAVTVEVNEAPRKTIRQLKSSGKNII